MKICSKCRQPIRNAIARFCPACGAAVSSHSTSPQQIEACWEDPRNRKWGIYHCKADPRWIVPKHPKWMGWTINTAHPASFLALGVMIMILTVPGLLAAYTSGNVPVVLGACMFALSVVCILCVLMSRIE